MTAAFTDMSGIATPEPELPAGVTVIVPSFRGRDHITTCMRSLAAQTLDTARFEVIVVLNGPDDGTGALLDRFRRRHPALRLRVLRSAEPGASRARNTALAVAAHRLTAFVDHDDAVSPGYLDVLLAHARPGVIPFAQIVDVTADGGMEPANPINLQALPFAGQTVPPGRVPRALGFNACKLIPTALARSIGYDVHLTSGVDVVFFMQVLARQDFQVHVCPIDDGPSARNAVYYRLLRPNSMSRRDMTFEFSVRDRLEVISRVDALLPGLPDEPRRRVLQSTISAQAGFIDRYLGAHPAETDRVLETIASYRLTDFPYRSLTHAAERLRALRPAH